MENSEHKSQVVKYLIFAVSQIILIKSHSPGANISAQLLFNACLILVLINNYIILKIFENNFIKIFRTPINGNFLLKNYRGIITRKSDSFEFLTKNIQSEISVSMFSLIFKFAFFFYEYQLHISSIYSQ